MKIVFLSFYQQAVNRGVENWLRELGLRLKEGAEVEILGPRAVKKSLLDPTGSWVRRVFLDRTSRAILGDVLQRLSRLKQADIIVPLNGGWQVLVSKLAAKLYGRKLVIVGQAGLGFDDRWNLLWRPDLFIALSRAQQKWASRYYQGRIEVIPNGVDLELFNPQGKAYKTRLKPPVILCAASLEKSHFFKELILACVRAQASLLIAGSGEQKREAEIDKWGREHLKKRYLRKQFSRQEMPAVYRGADLFVYPNPSWESFGIVFLEAMASNLGIVAGDDPIRREIIDRAGVFVNPASTDSILAGIRKGLTKNWQEIPRQQAKKFAWPKIAAEYRRVFSSLIN